MYRKILVPLDGSATAEAGLREAIPLAAALKARLCLLNVLIDLPMLVELSSAMNSQEVQTGLQQYGRDLLAKAERAAAEGGAEAGHLGFIGEGALDAVDLGAIFLGPLLRGRNDALG